MSTAYSEFARVCQQVKHWPSDWRQHLAEEIAKSLASEPPTDNGEWNDAKNERRHDAIRIHLSRLAPSTAARALGGYVEAQL